MLRLIYTLLLLTISSIGICQVGNGILFMTDTEYQFPGTTVDSTSTFEFQVVNDLGAPQTIFFSALDAPFSLLDNSPIEIAANDTTTVMLIFEPTAIGTYNGSLEAVGGVFGSATLNFSGEGIQVVLEWTPESLVFDTTAIGQTDAQVVSITSSGNGDGVISAIEFSNPVFSVDSATSSFTIAEGATNDLTFVFAPIGAGAQSGTATLHTNDPSNPQIVLDLSGTGISEVSGDICDMVWTAENSPYTLVGDVVVPEGCTLTLEAGTEVIGNDYDIEVLGSFYANGEEGNEVVISCGELISHTAKEQMVFTHSEMVETNSFDFFDADYRLLRDACDSLYGTVDSLPSFLDSLVSWDYHYENENSAMHIAKFYEDFNDNNSQGWSHEGDITSSYVSQEYFVEYYYGSSGSYFNLYIQTPTLALNPGENEAFISFDKKAGWWSNTHYFYVYISIDGGAWEQIYNETNPSNSYTNTSIATEVSGANSVRYRFHYRMRHYGSLRIDNFEFTTNFYPGFDLPPSFNSNSLSSGGIDLHNTAFIGDFHSANDSLSVNLDNSSIGVNPNREKDSHGLGLYADHVEIASVQSAVSGHALDGIHIESDLTDWISTETSVADNGAYGISVNGDLDWTSTEDVIDGNGEDGVDVGANSNLTMYGPEIWNNGARGLAAADGSVIDLDYARIEGNGSHGVDLENTGTLNMDNCRLLNNSGQGIQSGSPTTLNHCNLAFNGGTGLVLTGNNFHTLNNSILWGNNETNYTQIDIGGGVISTSYSTVQGQSGYGVTGSGQFYWGEGVIEADPLFADDDLHLNTYSPCVDGGQPWLMDAHMPYGLGGVRADMGMYGGPDNAYWGGLALPDGASTLQSVQDSPQDQGNTVGLTFSSSFYDNSELVNNVTHYAFWRHFDPTGAPITDVAEGNWELLGEMPSLSLNNYAYQAPTLGNTNAFGDFSSCYFVAAHTADDDTYWISNVMCGESVDNLAPDDPDLNGLVLETGEAQISWTPPTEEDYAYTEIYNDDGFTAEVGNDTLVLDPSVIPGYTYTYTAVNYDVNGNASDASSLTLEIPAGLDIIPLTAGWNLISTDRSASTPAIEDVLSSLNEGNVEYVTGFNNGVVLYDPDGYFLFNTLDEFESGYGYWIKVQEDDTLEIAGSLLTDGYMPSLNMGWNLIGYPNAENSTVEAYFDQLLSDESLEYVTGFNQGSSYFDPNGLPFLNSLVQLENGFGYWLKVSQAYDFNGLVTDQVDEPLAALSGATGIAQPNPNYMLLNGTSNLAQEAGKQALVHALDGTVVGALPILEGGYLMTTALYGDDPATEALEGLQAGDEVYFSFEGKRSKEAVVYNGQMELRHINLEFEVQSLFEVFPNPFAESITISGVLEVGGMLDAVVTDSQGRVVAQRPAIEMTAGSYSLDWELPRLAPGYYNCTLRLEGVTLDSMPIMHVEQ